MIATFGGIPPGWIPWVTEDLMASRAIRRFTPWLNPAVVVLALAAGAAAHASPITYQFSGKVTSSPDSFGGFSVYVSDPTATQPIPIAPIGTPFSGTLTFDPEGQTAFEYLSHTALDLSGTSYWSDPITHLSPVGLSLQVGGQTVLPGNFRSANLISAGSQGPSTIYVQPDYGIAPNVLLTLSNTQKLLSLTPGADARDWFGIPSIPKTLSLSAYPFGTIRVIDPTSHLGYVGTIDSLTVVPEPSTAAVVCAGVVGLLAYSHRPRPRRSPL
jgi:hypothetical protein